VELFDTASYTTDQRSNHNYLNYNLERYLPLDVKGLNPIKRVKKRWWTYLRWCYDLQWYMEEQGGRTFSILPLSTYAAKYITIDTGILHDLLTRVSRRTGDADPGPLPEFRADKRWHWEKFHLISTK
jgi:hypothetical protein